jgi:hypothetical protein
MPKKKGSGKFEKDFGQIILEHLYKEAVQAGVMLYPDEAMKEFSNLIREIVEVNKFDIQEFRQSNPRTNIIGHSQKLHHYAVDLFYRTYSEATIGAPPISNEYLILLVELRNKGLSHGKIAKELGMPTSPQNELRKSSDRIRKQLDIAEKRLNLSSKPTKNSSKP